tara:strand:- start:4723 stop:5013 length:291 start_codon:yes stop_codon:yes gene_type:complete
MRKHAALAALAATIISVGSMASSQQISYADDRCKNPQENGVTCLGAVNPSFTLSNLVPSGTGFDQFVAMNAELRGTGVTPDTPVDLFKFYVVSEAV